MFGMCSAGKSTLIEQILGLEFLPKGQSEFTRRPLELRLSYVPESQCGQLTAEFIEEIKGIKFTDFDEVRQNIYELTNKVCGTSKNITDKQILLAIQGPSCPDLTLIDLPGIRRVPITGQPNNIEEITTNMAKSYCEDKSAIILCVVAANQFDSRIFSLAKKFDPKGTMTLGVITKIDLLGQRVNIWDILNESIFPLQYDKVAVKLRSQQDTQDQLIMIKSFYSEKKFFSQHPIYKNLDSQLFGVESLIKKIMKIIWNRIDPISLLNIIDDRLKILASKQQILGSRLPETDQDKYLFILKLIQAFAVTFQKTIEGKYLHSQLLNKSKVSAKQQIFQVFYELYLDFTEADYNPFIKYSDFDVFLLIKNFEALKISGFLPMDAFNALLKPELEKLIVPANDAVDQIANILEEYSNAILNAQLIYESLKQLKETFQTWINEIIFECQIQTKAVVNDALRAEIDYIFSNDFQFKDQTYKLFILFASYKDELQYSKFVAELKKQIRDYFQLVVRAVRDNIPKLIGFFLIKKCQIQILKNLQLNLWQNQEILNLIKEEPRISAERESVINQISILKGIQRIILNNNQSSQRQVKLSDELKNNDSELSSNQFQESINQIVESKIESGVELQITHEEKIAILQQQTILIQENELITPASKRFKMVHLEQQILYIQKSENLEQKPERIQQKKKQIDQKCLEVLFQVIAKILKDEQERELVITQQQLFTGLDSLFTPDLKDYKCYKYKSQKQQRRNIDFNGTLSDFENHIQKLKIQLADLEILEVSPEIGEVFFNFKDNKKYLLKEVCKDQIEVYNYFINPNNKSVGLSPSDFDPKHNKIWSLKHKEKEQRGPKGMTYDYFFPRGYTGYALNVEEKYGQDNNWIKMDGNDGEWRIFYHGTKRQYLENIVEEGLKAGKGQIYRNQICLITKEKVGEGIYLTDNIKVAEKFTDKIKLGDQEFHLVFQTRVNPKAIRQSQRMKEKSYFVVNHQKDIRPYRILLRKENLKQEKIPDKTCISF